MSTPGTYGGLKYESTTDRALGQITDEQYQKVYDDQAALTSKLINDVSFMAANLRKVQQQADQADENVVQQLQDFVNDIQVIMGGQGDTGFDFGDFKYVLQAYGALFDFIGPDGTVQVPTNLNQATQNFFNQYLFGGQNWQQAFDSQTDSEIATMLDIMGEVPVLNQAAEQLAVILSKNRDDIDTITSVFGTFFSAFNIPPGGSFDLADFMNATNALYLGLESLFSDVNYGSFQPIFEQMSRWDQKVIDAIYQLSEGNIQALIGLLPISQLTNSQPNLQPESDFADSDSIAANNAGWSWDGSVGNQSLGSAKLVCDGLLHGMNGDPIAIDEGQTLNPQVSILWSGVTSTGVCVQLIIRGNNGVDYVVDSTALTNPNGGWLELSGAWVNPTGSGITSARTRIVVTSAVTAGTIWFDDAPNTVSGTLIPQDWINGLTEQWNTFLASMGFSSAGDYIGADPATIWNTWLNSVNTELNLVLTPTSSLDANYFTGDPWTNLLALFGVTPLDLSGGSVDFNTLWTEISTSFLLPTGTVPSIDITNDLTSAINQLGDIFNNEVVDPISTAVGNVLSWFNAQVSSAENLLSSLYASTTPPTPGTTKLAAAAVPNITPAMSTGIQDLTDSVTQGITGNSQTGQSPAQAQAAVQGLSSSVSSVQSQLIAVQNALPSSTPLGTEVSDLGDRVTTHGWGSNWNVTGVLDVANNGDFHANLASSAQQVIGIYNAAQTLSDYQVIDIVISALPDNSFNNSVSGFGGIARADSPTNPQNYLYWRYYATGILEIGAVVAGVKHSYGTAAVAAVAGSRWRVIVGITGNLYTIDVYQNNRSVGAAVDTYHNAGAGFRYCGMALWSDYEIATNQSPGKISQFSFQDNSPSGIVGSYLQAQTSGSYVGIASGINNVPNGFFVLQENSPDITMDSNGLITVHKDSTYIFFVKIVIQTALSTSNAAQIAMVKNGVSADSGTVHPGGTNLTSFNEVFFIPASAGDTFTVLTNFTVSDNIAGSIKVSTVGH